MLSDRREPEEARRASASVPLGSPRPALAPDPEPLLDAPIWACPQRRRNAVRDRDALDRAGPGPHRRRRVRHQQGGQLGRVPRPRPRCSRCPRRTSSTPTWRATSATSRRAGSRCAARATASGPPPAGTRRTTGPATSRSTSCRTCSTRRGYVVTANQAVIGASTSTCSPTTGATATAASASYDMIGAAGRGRSRGRRAEEQFDNRNGFAPTLVPAAAEGGAVPSRKRRRAARPGTSSRARTPPRRPTTTHLAEPAAAYLRRAARARPTAATAGSR